MAVSTWRGQSAAHVVGEGGRSRGSSAQVQSRRGELSPTAVPGWSVSPQRLYKPDPPEAL